MRERVRVRMTVAGAAHDAQRAASECRGHGEGAAGPLPAGPRSARHVAAQRYLIAAWPIIRQRGEQRAAGRTGIYRETVERRRRSRVRLLLLLLFCA